MFHRVRGSEPAARYARLRQPRWLATAAHRTSTLGGGGGDLHACEGLCVGWCGCGQGYKMYGSGGWWGGGVGTAGLRSGGTADGAGYVGGMKIMVNIRGSCQSCGEHTFKTRTSLVLVHLRSSCMVPCIGGRWGLCHFRLIVPPSTAQKQLK